MTVDERDLPLCQRCNYRKARSFAPDGSMACMPCRLAEDLLTRTDAAIRANLLPPAASEARSPFPSIDWLDRAYVWQDVLGTHWGWLDRYGWTAWNSGTFVYGHCPLGPFTRAYKRRVGEWSPTLLFVGDYAIGADLPAAHSNARSADENRPTSSDTVAGEPRGQTLDEDDPVNHPSHYTSSPARCSKCGHPIECIDITRHMGFNLGNTTKYVWRCDLKNDAIEDLEKAVFFLLDEIAERKRQRDGGGGR